MAEPVSFPEAAFFVGPNDQAGGSGGGFPMSIELGSDGSVRFVSCWRPTPEELEEILRTRRIWLEVRADRLAHPAVTVHGHRSEVIECSDESTTQP